MRAYNHFNSFFWSYSLIHCTYTIKRLHFPFNTIKFLFRMDSIHCSFKVNCLSHSLWLLNKKWAVCIVQGLREYAKSLASPVHYVRYEAVKSQTPTWCAPHRNDKLTGWLPLPITCIIWKQCSGFHVCQGSQDAAIGTKRGSKKCTLSFSQWQVLCTFI